MSALTDCDCCHLGFPEDIIMPFIDDKDEFSMLCPVCALQKVRKQLENPQAVFTTEVNKARLSECISYMTLNYSDVHIPKTVLLD